MRNIRIQGKDITIQKSFNGEGSAFGRLLIGTDLHENTSKSGAVNFECCHTIVYEVADTCRSTTGPPECRKKKIRH